MQIVNSINDVEKALNSIDTFSNVSGLILNRTKTEGLCIGQYRDIIPDNKSINWPLTPIRYLGIFVGTDDKECEILNWTNKLEKMQKLVDCWRTRYLTIQGKILIIKALILPKLTYVASMLSIPDHIVKETNTIFFRFIWGKRDKIQRNILINSFENGGLKMVDIESHFMALKAAWIPRLIDDTKGIWKHLPLTYTYQITKGLLNEMTFETKDQMPCLKTIPNFYAEVILAFSKARCRTTIENKSDLFNQLLWGNRLFMINNKCLYSVSFIESDILHVKDILEVDGSFKNDTFQWLKDKRHYLRVINLIKDSLKAYKCYRFGNSDTTNKVLPSPNWDGKRSKYFYLELIKKKAKCSKALRKLNMNFESNTNWSIIHANKIKKQFEVRISDFNFKLLNNIVPTGNNLFKWKKANSANCIYCHNPNHDIKHLLWECPHIQHLWDVVQNTLDICIDYFNIIIGITNQHDMNCIISLICYIIYKKYLGDRQNIQNMNIYTYIAKEISYRIHIYSSNICNDTCKTFLTGLITNLFSQVT